MSIIDDEHRERAELDRQLVELRNERRALEAEFRQRVEQRRRRSVIDWLSGFYSHERNPYLRLRESDRTKLGIRMTVFLAVVAAIFVIWRLLRAIE